MPNADLEKLKETLISQHNNDEKQLEVIFSTAPRVIVEAPAGYGKTTTMISRIAYLFASGRIPNPKKVLGLTFSVNAALKVKREIAEKLPALMRVQNNPTAINDKVTVTNYHGFCKSILKKYGYLVTDQLRKDVNLYKAIGEKDIGRYDELKSLLSAPETIILNEIESTIKAGNIPTETLTQNYNNLVIHKLLPLGYITHNAVILIAIDLLVRFPQVQKFYQNYYPLLIVDEFQDTNSIAWSLLKLLISEKSQLLFLGDPLQRIYGFIGALPDIMSTAATEYDMFQITLSKNYRFRSNPEMLKLDYNIRSNAAANFSFDPGLNIAQLPAFWGTTQSDEATQIAEKILELMHTEPGCKISVLCRGRNRNSEEIERVLSSNNIAYFYALFSDEDQNYIDFHIKCQNAFIRKFDSRKSINNRTLTAFVDSIKSEYSDSSDRIILSLLSLLDALIAKVSTDYATITPEDKYSLLLDIFENRQLKQAMEYVDANVIVSTIHGAKGLEWEYVFLPDVERWIFPNFYTCNECSNKYSLFNHCKCKIDLPVEDKLSRLLIDEISVFYVGITRARKQVFISASSKRYNSYDQEKNSGFSCMASLEGIKLTRA